METELQELYELATSVEYMLGYCKRKTESYCS